ncbi:hypothetical protein MP228_009993 [Amoeboaphelidium protococcarum]|nr:hypothetical protein MP228_009993 [Amoeboaphelidium protococcarum]
MNGIGCCERYEGDTVSSQSLLTIISVRYGGMECVASRERRLTSCETTYFIAQGNEHRPHAFRYSNIGPVVVMKKRMDGSRYMSASPSV